MVSALDFFLNKKLILLDIFLWNKTNIILNTFEIIINKKL